MWIKQTTKRLAMKHKNRERVRSTHTKPDKETANQGPLTYRKFMVRWRQVLETNAAIRTGEAPNAGDLANKLEVSVRTIRRDLDFMRELWVRPSPTWLLDGVSFTQRQTTHYRV
jgi:hypothetical protein